MVKYVVREGDTLARIAERFHTTVDELRHWNREVITFKDVPIGTLLTISGTSEGLRAYERFAVPPDAVRELDTASAGSESPRGEAAASPVNDQLPQGYTVPYVDPLYRTYALPTVTFDGYRGMWTVGVPVMTYPIAGTIGIAAALHPAAVDLTGWTPRSGSTPVNGTVIPRQDLVQRDRVLPNVVKSVKWEVYDEASTATWVSSSMGRSSRNPRAVRPSEALYDETSSAYGSPSYYSLTFESDSSDTWSESMHDEDSPSR